MRHRFVVFAPVLFVALAAAGVAVPGAVPRPTALTGAGALASVAPGSPVPAQMDSALLRRAEALVSGYAVIDVHAHDPGRPPSAAVLRQVTLPLMKQAQIGGLVQMVPFSQQPSDRPVETILADLRRVKADLEAHPGVALVLTADGFERNRRLGLPALMLGVEYFQGLLDGRVETLDTYHREGVRVVGLSHGGKDLVTEGEGGSRTLTAFGRKAIERMNALGIVCDVTHVPDAVRRQVIAASRAPILVSHAAARSLVPSPFNVDDETLDRLASNKGLIGVTFYSGQLSKETLAQNARIQDPTRLPPARVEDLVDQIDYLRRRVGIDFVALGSDFGRSGRTAPTGLATIEGLPLVAYHMLTRGYSEREIAKVLGGNFVDFIERVERAALAATIHQAVSAQDAPETRIQTTKVTDGVLVLSGGGANVGMSTGENGVLLVDAGIAASVEKLKAAVAALDRRPPRFVLDTNWHYDHADGNEAMAALGATVVAHPRCRPHMVAEQRITEADPVIVIPPYPRGALPVVTLDEPATIHFNGEDIAVIHVPAAHSDGDLAYHFRRSNVLFTGDLFFPAGDFFIHYSGGGTLAGMIRAVDRFLALANDETQIVPGHGPVCRRADLVSSRSFLVAIRDRIQARIAKGESMEQVVRADPLRDLFIDSPIPTPGRWAQLVYQELSRAGER